MSSRLIEGLFGSPYGSHSQKKNNNNNNKNNTRLVSPYADPEAEVFKGTWLENPYIRSLNREHAAEIRRQYYIKNPPKGGAKKKKISLENRTKDELIQTAKKRGCKCNNNMKKSEIIAMLRR